MPVAPLSCDNQTCLQTFPYIPWGKIRLISHTFYVPGRSDPLGVHRLVGRHTCPSALRHQGLPVPNGGRPRGSKRRENVHSRRIPGWRVSGEEAWGSTLTVFVSVTHWKWPCQWELCFWAPWLWYANQEVENNSSQAPSWGWASCWQDDDSGLFLCTYYTVGMGSKHSTCLILTANPSMSRYYICPKFQEGNLRHWERGVEGPGSEPIQSASGVGTLNPSPAQNTSLDPWPAALPGSTLTAKPLRFHHWPDQLIHSLLTPGREGLGIQNKSFLRDTDLQVGPPDG